MAKDEQSTSKQVPQHHRMAQGQKILGAKKGGHVKKEEHKKEHKKKK